MIKTEKDTDSMKKKELIREREKLIKSKKTVTK